MTAEKSPLPLIDTVAACLAAGGFAAEREAPDENGIVALRFGVEAGSGRWIAYARCDEAQRQLVVYAVFPVDAPTEHRAAIAECLHRANRGMAIGNFEIDLDDGEVLFKTSLDLGDEVLSPGLVQALLDANTLAMDTYFPALMDVLYGGIAPLAALARVEQGG